MDVFTPNTGQTKNLKTGEERARGDGWTKGDHGYFTGSTGTGSGGSSNGGASGRKSAKKVDKSEKDAIIEHKEEIIADFKSSGFNGEVHIPPREIDVNSLSYDKRLIMDENHDVNLKSARQYIRNAKVSYTKYINGEEFENYIGDKGATYVNITANSIRTAFPKAEFTPGTKRFLETVNKHLK